jgi:hypothetical protein
MRMNSTAQDLLVDKATEVKQTPSMHDSSLRHKHTRYPPRYDLCIDASIAIAVVALQSLVWGESKLRYRGFLHGC